eukprot:4795284-Prorocentrum_lima.AAC.1
MCWVVVSGRFPLDRDGSRLAVAGKMFVHAIGVPLTPHFCVSHTTTLLRSLPLPSSSLFSPFP